MPKVPLYENQAQPSESSKPFIQSPIETGATEKAWQKLAGSVSVRAEKYQQEQDALTVAETISKLNDNERKMMEEEFKREGSNAVGASARGAEFYETQIKELGGTLRGKSHEMFRQQALRVRDGGLNRLSQHEAQQHQVRKKQDITAMVEGIRADIRSGAGQEDVEERARILFDTIDQSYAGLDMSEWKATLRDQIYSEYLDSVMVKRPNDIAEATQRWHNVMPTEKLNGYLKKVDMANAMRDLYNDPKNFKAENYASLDPVQRAQLDQQSKELRITRLKEMIAIEERNDRIAERDLRKARENTELKLMDDYYKGGLSVEKIQKMRDLNLLDPTGYTNMMKLAKGEGAQVNNHEVLSRLMTQIEFHQDATQEIKEAFANGHLRGDTFQQLVKSSADNQYKDGLSQVNAALTPSPFEKGYQSAALRHSEGIERYNRYIAMNKSPREAAAIVVEEYRKQVVATNATKLPRPKYLDAGADRNDPAAYDNVMKRTQEAMKKKEITGEEYADQLIVIDQNRRAAQEYQNRFGGKDADQRKKDLEKAKDLNRK